MTTAKYKNKVGLKVLSFAPVEALGLLEAVFKTHLEGFLRKEEVAKKLLD